MSSRWRSFNFHAFTFTFWLHIGRLPSWNSDEREDDRIRTV